MHVHSTGHQATQASIQTTNPGTDTETAPNTSGVRGFSSNAHPADRVDLSPAAQAMLDASGDSTGPGKSGLSPAHRARALIATQPELANLPFGKIVSGLIHGTLALQPATVGTTTDQTTDDSTDPTAGTVGTDTTATDGAGTDSNSDTVASSADSTNTDASQTTTNSTPPTDGSDSGTPVADIVPPLPTFDTESTLLDALTNTNQNATISDTAT